MSSFSRLELENQLKQSGNKLLGLISTDPQVKQLLIILDHVDVLLTKVEQAPSLSMQDALYPSMKALISNQLLRHSSMDVKVSVASCMSELTRITAPDAPYDDDQMKEIFQLTLTALGILSNEDSRIYPKALHILDNIAKVRSCLLMLDLECDRLVVDMFQQFLSIVRYDHPTAVVTQMEYIMTLTLEESEEVSHDLLHVLLASVNKRNVDQNCLPPSWRLGEKVLNNCAVELQRFLPDMCRSMNLDFGDYSDIVASICQNSHGDQPEVAEADPSAGEPSDSVRNDGICSERVNGTLREQNSSKTTENCYQVKQQKNTEVGGCAQPETSEVTGTVQAEVVKIPKRRGRKPKSMLKSEEQYHNSATGERRESFKEPLCPKNNEKKGGSPKQSGSRQEERETTNCIVSPRTLQLENTSASTPQNGNLADGKQSRKARRKNNSTVIAQDREVGDKTNSKTNHDLAKVVAKKEYDDSEEYFEKHSTRPHGIKEYGQELVGRKVKVWWPMDKAYYEGAVASFDPVEKKHTVLYADGDVETLNMSNELWKLAETNIYKQELHAEILGPAAASHRSRKRKINTKSESSAKRGIPSSSKRRKFSDESETEAPKSGNFAPSTVRMADTTNDESTALDSILKCTGDAYDSKPGNLPSADVTMDKATSPIQINDKLKLKDEEPTKTLRTSGKPGPHAVAEFGVEDAVNNTGRVKPKSSLGKPTEEDAEKEKLPDSVDALESDGNTVKKRRRSVNCQGFALQHESAP